MTRREILKLLLFGGLSLSAIPLGIKPAMASLKPAGCTGNLSVHNIHTNESLSVCYLTETGQFDPNGLTRLNRLFRCHYTHQINPIDPRLFVLLDSVRNRVGANNRPLHLISGYRSPEYHQLLRSKSSNVAKRSYHLKGMAADVRIDGISLSAIRKAATGLKFGGVGSYSQFIHVDVGPVRYW